jgi:hypothetical protein
MEEARLSAGDRARLQAAREEAMKHEQRRSAHYSRLGALCVTTGGSPTRTNSLPRSPSSNGITLAATSNSANGSTVGSARSSDESDDGASVSSPPSARVRLGSMLMQFLNPSTSSSTLNLLTGKQDE